MLEKIHASGSFKDNPVDFIETQEKREIGFETGHFPGDEDVLHQRAQKTRD
jgi:hypothetical protein